MSNFIGGLYLLAILHLQFWATGPVQDAARLYMNEGHLEGWSRE